MSLINDVKRVCDRISTSGWRELMLKHGIDIKQSNAQKLADALDVEINIDSSIPGFEDFINSQARGIEPGNVAASLLYHAFASPGVNSVPGDETAMGTMSQPITDFPTVEELDIVQNYIYAKADRSLVDVQQHAAELLNVSSNSIELAVVVFAAEYRPASETTHQRYADLCLSRTGVARVGTTSAIYNGKLRGYLPFQDGDTTHAIRVLPCQYTTWLAVRSRAKENCFGPARIQQADTSRDFWVPVHKLFDGKECLKDDNLRIELTARHQNKKIERLHQHLEDEGFSSGFTAVQRQNPPFIQEHGLADWLGIFQGGSGLLGPQPQPLAERASFNNTHLTFPSPAMTSGGFDDAFSPTLSLSAPPPPVRPWPEYAHVRFDVQNDNAVYFGDDANAEAHATAGGYRALNISDSTADGWIKASVSGIASIESVPAYSLIAAPDFFPAVDQREVFEWWENIKDPNIVPTLPQWMQSLVQEGYWEFWRAEPFPLSDVRFAPNITLTDSGFDDRDITVTSIVAPLQSIDLQKPIANTVRTLRHAILPDAAAGVFAPGWDTSADRIPGSGSRNHLSSYGLGSPFPEDAKLCAALSTFWPAAAPDTARTFFKVDFARGTVCPLTDEENGSAPGSISWDGLRGPHVLTEDNRSTTVRYPSYELADYTQNALEGRFSIAETQKIDFREYTNRIIVTLRMYRTLSQIGDKNSLHILSFRPIESRDDTLLLAQNDTNTSLSGPIYRFDIFDDDNASSISSSNVREQEFSIDIIYTLLVGTGDFLLAMARRGDGSQARSRWLVINV